MKLRLTALLALLAAVATVVVAAPTAGAKPKAPAANVNVPVTGTVANDAGTAVGTFTGHYTVNRVIRHGRKFLAVGTVTGVVTNTATGATQTVNRAVKVPLKATSGGTARAGARAGGPNAIAAPLASCEILDLVLGPLDLDLLGLVVHLDTVHLNITAESGPGNLLGNLLCAVAGLLDGPTTGGIGGILNQIVGLLNQILGQLGG